MNDIVNVITDNKTLIISIIIFFVCVIIGFFGDLYLKKQNKMSSKKDLNDDALQKEETKEETKQEILDKQDMDSTYEPDNLPIDTVDNKDELNTINSNIDDNNFDNSNISSDTNIKEFNEPYENPFNSSNINTDNQNIENQNDTYQYSNINFNTDDDNKFNNMF